MAHQNIFSQYVYPLAKFGNYLSKIKLESMNTVALSICDLNIPVAIHSGFLDTNFYKIGLIKEAKENHLKLKAVDYDGEIIRNHFIAKYDEITALEFESFYANLYCKYAFENKNKK